MNSQLRLSLALPLALVLLVACARPVAPPAPITARVTSSPAASAAPVRAIGLSPEDYQARRPELAAFSAELRARGVNMVGLTAGRLDWTYFPWPGHEDRWSSDVRRTGVDYLAEGAGQFGPWSHVSAIVDVFVGRYLEAHPDAAARSADGEPSSFQVSTYALVEGAYGDQLLELIEHIAATYPVDSITLTELFYDQYGYGDDDGAAYRAYTGRDDWPRTEEGAIATSHPSIGDWRSHALSRFVARAAAVAHHHGKELFVDVRVSWDNLANEGRESGQDYGRFLEHADRLVLWNYFGLSTYGPAYTAAIARSVAKYGPGQVIISVGLWAEGGETVAPEQLAQALRAIEASGIPNSWVTPSHMLSNRHWQVIDEQWADP